MVQDLSKEEQIKREFQSIKAPLEDTESVVKCSTLCAQYSLTPNALALKWESYVLNLGLKGKNVRPTSKELVKFKNSLESSQKQFKKATRKPTKIYDKDNIHSIQDVFSEYGVEVSAKEFKNDVVAPEAPTKSKKQSSIQFEPMVIDDNSSPAISWKDRLSAGQVVFTYNEKLSANPEVDERVSVDIEIDEEYNQVKPFRFMNDRVSEKSEVLESQLEELSSAIVKENKILTDNPPSIFHVPSQDEITAVGRIGSEVEGKLGDVAVVLESSRDEGKARVRILLKNANDYSIFPGQVIASRGVNPTGKLLMINQIFEGASLPFYNTRIHSQNPLSVIAASGPWTTSNNLLYEPLNSLLEEIGKDAENAPDVLILVGPFIDADHPQVKSGDLTITYEDLFKVQVSPKLTQFIATVHTKVILVPSFSDVQHDYYVFPQPPFDKEELGLDSEIIVAPNPATIVINDVTIGISSNDIIAHLGNEEVSKTPKGEKRVEKLCEHLLNQQSYYPLYPPRRGAQVDFSHSKQFKLPFTPDILVLPSDYESTHFVKSVNDALFVNPGRVCTSTNAGTLAHLVVHPNQNKQKHTPVATRTRVDIKRI